MKVIGLLVIIVLLFTLNSVPAQANSTYEFSGQLTLLPNYFGYIQLHSLHGQEIMMQLMSSVPVNVYLMTQAQFNAFNTTGTSGSLRSASGTSISEIAIAPESGTYYIVIDNSISFSEAQVSYDYSLIPVDIFTLHSSSPASVGIVDYGIENISGTLIPYQVSATGITGYAKIYSISAYNSTPPVNISKYGASLQLNVMLQVNSTRGQFVYWLQNFANFQTNNSTVSFGDNVWNASAINSTLDSQHIKGKGGIISDVAQSTTAYAYETPFSKYPLPFEFILSTSETSSLNIVTIHFSYQINGYPKQIFDNVMIDVPGLDGAAIVVSGYGYTPLNNYYDAELVFAGQGNGEITTFNNMNTTLNMFYTLPNGSTIEPYTVYTFGSDTGESAYNLRTTNSNGTPVVILGKTNFTQYYVTRDLPLPVIATNQTQANQQSFVLLNYLLGFFIFLIVIVVIIVKKRRSAPRDPSSTDENTIIQYYKI
ncbi:MAG: thermopsin [Conexivisphaerales archaeon]